MTLDGTNTWVLVEPGALRALVVDPGPDDPGHLEAIIDAARDADGAEVALIVLTHGHPDHAEAARAFAALTGAPVRALAPALCAGAPPLADREQLDVDGLKVEVVASPGHTGDSACLLVEQDRALLTGDTLLGRGSTVVAHPDGRLGDYLDTLRRLRGLVDGGRVNVVLPGHGPVRNDPADLIDGYLAHRHERLDAVRAAAAAGTDVESILDAVYAEVDTKLRKAARWSVLAQLDYLRERGEIAT
jgi:glyoxylase-like metal-dependent hydrolase (beta-lactamase superfamily II)